jgi:hypothetical protein
MRVSFNARQSIELTVLDQGLSIPHYLRQPKRLVNALVDPSRLQYLGEDIFRLKMRPLNFLHLSIQPTVDMKVWASAKGTVYLKSVACEILGVEYINQRFTLDLVGILEPKSAENGSTYLKGQADLQVGVDLPPPLWLTPKSILETTGNGLLKSVLMTIKQRLSHQLLLDYQRWAQDQMMEPQVNTGMANAKIVPQETA